MYFGKPDFNDEVSQFYKDSYTQAGKFEPSVIVWSEMAVRAAIVKAQQKIEVDLQTATNTNITKCAKCLAKGFPTIDRALHNI
jgi:hypothetical protein